MYLPRILIGSLYCLCPLWLARVITLVLVLLQSIENSSTVMVTSNYSLTNADVGKFIKTSPSLNNNNSLFFLIDCLVGVPCVSCRKTSLLTRNGIWISSILKDASNILARTRLVKTSYVTKYAPAKTWAYRLIFPIFQIQHVSKHIWRKINTKVSIWRENMLGYFSLDIICSS